MLGESLLTLAALAGEMVEMPRPATVGRRQSVGTPSC